MALHVAASSTYVVVDLPLSWHAAQEYCALRGGHLATITSAAQNSEVISLLTNASSSLNAWLGATDEDSEGMWTWMYGGSTNSTLPPTSNPDESYDNWMSGQPDNYDSNEHCMMMIMDKNDGSFWWATEQKWVDYMCWQTLPFVCQNLNVWLPDTNYTVFKQPKLQWSQASAYCTSLGGSLASITSAYDNAVIVKAMEDASLNDGWIGGNDIASEGTWRWSKDDKSFCSSYCGMTPTSCGSNYNCGWTSTWACPGGPAGSGGYAGDDGSEGYYCCCIAPTINASYVPPYDYAYSNWKSGQPNNQGGNEDCARIQRNDQKWYDKPCTNTDDFICEFPLLEAPPPPPVTYVSWAIIEYSTSDCTGAGTVSTSAPQVTSQNPTSCVQTGSNSVQGQWCNMAQEPPTYEGTYFAGSTNCSGTGSPFVLASSTCVGIDATTSQQFVCGFDGLPSPSPEPSPSPDASPSPQPSSSPNPSSSSYVTWAVISYPNTDCSGTGYAGVVSSMETTQDAAKCVPDDAGNSVQGNWCDMSSSPPSYEGTYFAGSSDCSGTGQPFVFTSTTCLPSESTSLQFVCGYSSAGMNTPMMPPMPPASPPAPAWQQWFAMCCSNSTSSGRRLAEMGEADRTAETRSSFQRAMQRSTARYHQRKAMEAAMRAERKKTEL